ncbi:PspA/IM30 family protein [Plectonema radiosum NIES-515]|uniref:PspA/IM30 family protein n=2 Tax=Plectonema TaxID=1183 RepID=A0ABT3AU31_9CYAN|nr:PspA/IM30 family protein [Plectonema radiosum NIES-515]
MELMKRIQRFIRANLNSMICRGSDPEKILEQAVMEMHSCCVQLRQAVAQAIATQKRTERQTAQAKSTAEEWYRRAQLALQANNEPLAREALTKRRAYQETHDGLAAQIKQQDNLIVKMKQDMRSLEFQILEAKTKKDMYIARSRSAEASYRLQEMLSSSSTTSSLNTFERMEEKVLQLEAKSEAIFKLDSDDKISQFTKSESNNSIDGELAAMKVQLLSGADIIPHKDNN